MQPDLIIMTRILWPKGGHINLDVAKEKISRLFSLSNRLFYFAASSKLPRPCLCFPEQFDPVVSSFSADEISRQPPLFHDTLPITHNPQLFISPPPPLPSKWVPIHLTRTKGLEINYRSRLFVLFLTYCDVYVWNVANIHDCY